MESLIRENNELLETKNALNIVKDDLIAKLDLVESELSVARDERDVLAGGRARLQERLAAAEDEVRRAGAECESLRSRLKAVSEEEAGVPAAQRKRFTRLEMARVLMERNQYKEKLIELQEAVRWTELVRSVSVLVL